MVRGEGSPAPGHGVMHRGWDSSHSTLGAFMGSYLFFLNLAQSPLVVTFFFHCLQNVNLQRCAASSCPKVELFYLDMEVRVDSSPLEEQIQVCTWHVGPFPQPQRETHLPSVNAPFPSCLFSEASITCLFWSFFSSLCTYSYLLKKVLTYNVGI